MAVLAGRLSAIGLLLAALFPLWACAASILPPSSSSTFPQCGFSCTMLTEAQSSCEAAGQSTWVSCFCQSALIPSLHSSGSICSNCDAADQQLLSTWYNNYCKSGGQVYDNNPPPPPSTTAPTSSSPSASPSAHPRPSWWSTHYRWVIMAIALAVGFALIALGGVYFKRRHDAKRPNLYHGDNAGTSGTGWSQRGSGVIRSPPPAWAPSPTPMLTRGGRSASQVNVEPKGYPSRLSKF